MTDTSSSSNIRQKTKPDIMYLRDIELFLIGYKTAMNSLSQLGLGFHHLDVLHEAIEFIKKSDKI